MSDICPALGHGGLIFGRYRAVIIADDIAPGDGHIDRFYRGTLRPDRLGTKMGLRIGNRFGRAIMIQLFSHLIGPEGKALAILAGVYCVQQGLAWACAAHIDKAQACLWHIGANKDQPRYFVRRAQGRACDRVARHGMADQNGGLGDRVKDRLDIKVQRHLRDWCAVLAMAGQVNRRGPVQIGQGIAPAPCAVARAVNKEYRRHTQGYFLKRGG